MHCFVYKGTRLMRVIQKRATMLLCSVAVAALGGVAVARPVHHHRHHAVQATQAMAESNSASPERDMRYSGYPAGARAAVANEGTRRNGRRGSASGDPRAAGADESFIAAQSHSNSAYGGFTSNDLVSEARKYIGTNPTGRGSLWCGAFMDLVLKRTGHPGGGNLALAYKHYGTPVTGPKVGAIAVMGRRGGGHVGVVSGIDPNGNPIIVSGNHNHTVAEAVYPRSRISAYVMPGG
jgi:uncharacterized protein (TIGR02594 family)